MQKTTKEIFIVLNIKTIIAAVIGAAAIGLSVGVASSEAATVTNPANGNQYALIEALKAYPKTRIALTTMVAQAR
jgi:hypothetical protein